MSVAAGIPDFRSPVTGLYANLAKYKLPYPEAVFDIEYFKRKPSAFYTLAHELYPGNFAPTHCHRFIARLAARGRLRRCYTQNIDTLEREAGVPAELLVEAHGSFAAAACVACGAAARESDVRAAVEARRVPHCAACRTGLVKPSIVFFGEALPARFHALSERDFDACDLLLVIGTSLAVQPFASLTARVPATCPRVLINYELVGDFTRNEARDYAILRDCQDTIQALEEHLQWHEDEEKEEEHD